MQDYIKWLQQGEKSKNNKKQTLHSEKLSHVASSLPSHLNFIFCVFWNKNHSHCSVMASLIYSIENNML